MSTHSTESRRLAAIVFTDLAGYTALSQRDEALALALLAEAQHIQRDAFAIFKGREVKSTGDGFLAEFASAVQAMRCAVAIQEKFAQRNSVNPEDRHIHLRIGMHIGDIVERDGDIYGDGVNIAARVEPLADLGGISVSSAFKLQVQNKVKVAFERVECKPLKGLSDPIDVFRVVQSNSTAEPLKGSNRRGLTKVSKWVGLTTIAAVIGTGVWLMKAHGVETPSISPRNQEQTIAVLPFVNISANRDDEYLSDGMTEELLNKLAQVPGLRVPGRTSCFSFKGKNENDIFRKVGQQLHVSKVLEGSVRKAGDKVRITAQLINVADGYHIWSQTYDGAMNDVLAVQADVAKQVVNALQVKLGLDASRALTKGATTDPEAHRLYLLGRYHFGKNTIAGFKDAIQSYNRALERDPKFALAYCGLADCYGWMGGLQLTGKQVWEKERELAKKALAIDPNLADAHLSYGIALASACEWKQGEKEVKLALELNPKLALAFDQLAWIQSMLGRFDEAIANKGRAIDLDPLSTMYSAGLAEVLALSRKYDEAIAQLHKTLVLDPNFSDAYFQLGCCYLYKGDNARAISSLQKAKSLDPDLLFDALLAYAYARSGNRVMTEEILKTIDSQSKQHHVSPGLRALVLVGLGEKGQAFEWLERARLEQDFYCLGLKVNPFFDSLRNEPKFQVLLRKLGLN